MKIFKKSLAALLVGTLVISNVGVMPVVAETGTEASVIYMEDFNDATKSISYTSGTAVNDYSSNITAYARKKTFGDGAGTTDATYADFYGKTVDGENGYLYMRSSGGVAKSVNYNTSFTFNNISAVPTNEKAVWIQMDLKVLEHKVNECRFVVNDIVLFYDGEKATDGVYVSNTKKSAGCSMFNSDDTFKTIFLKFDGTCGFAYLDDNIIELGEVAMTELTSFQVYIYGNKVDVIAEEKANAGVCIDNVAVYTNDTKLDVFAEPTGVTIEEGNISLQVDDTKQLTATVETEGIVPQIVWTSDDESVATVSNDGLVTAKKMGKATITAKAGKIKATCVVTVGVTDVLYKQDFETISTFEELGYSAGGVEGYTPELRTEDYNKYLFLETGLVADKYNYVTIPMENAYENETLWVEMDIYTAQYYEPKRFQIIANDSSDMTSSAPTLAFKNTTLRNPGDNNKSICPLGVDEWVRLSYKADLEMRTITAYMDGTKLYEYQYKENWMPTCNYLKISIPVSSSDEGQMEGMGFCIDNLVVYVNEEQQDIFQPSIKGVNLGLEGKIAVKYHADLREIIANKRSDAYMKFTLLNGKTTTVKVSDIKQDASTGYYIFPCEVAAKEMTSVIKAQLFGGDDKALTDEISYTVYDNATFIIENAEETSEHYSEQYKKAYSIAKALLNYGGYAQKYFGHNISDLAYENYQDESITSITAEQLSKYKTVTVEKNSAIGSFYGVSLSLKSETALNYYFTLAEGVDVRELTFECNGNILVPTQVGNMYCIKVDNIGVIDLDTFYTVTVTYGDETMSVSCCALVYAYTILSLSDDSTAYKNLPELKNVCRALFKYNQKAEQYKAGVLKLFYYNSFDAKRELDSIYKTEDGPCSVEWVESGNYMKIGFKSEMLYWSDSRGYYQPNFSGATNTEKVVLEMSLSTDQNNVPDTSLQYKYKDSGSNTRNDLFSITDNHVQVGGTTIATVTKDEWIKIGIQLDCETGVYTVFVYNEAKGIYEAKATNTVDKSEVPISYIRFETNRETGGGYVSGSSLLIDDIVIYEGTDFLDMSQSEPLTAIQPETGIDAPIVFIGNSNYDAAPTFTQSTIDAAIALDSKIGTDNEKNYCWKSDGGNVHGAEKMAQALYYLILAARFDSDAAHSDGETTCVQSAVRKIEFLTTGGNEPFASVGPYWGHAILASAFALAKHTPAVYNVLSEDTKARMDCIMSALAIAGNWGYNDVNDYQTGFDLRGNFDKAWNPNFRNAYLSVVISASMYFGADELDEIFTTFSYDAYISRFDTYGFINMKSKWTELGSAKTLMEQGGTIDGLGSGVGVKQQFQYTYKDNGYNVTYDSGDIVGLFNSLADFTYAWKVRSDYGTPGGADYAYILSGKESPFQGQMGMMREFAASDSKGIRSDLPYTYSSWAILVSVYTNMKLLGGWDSSTDEMKKIDRRIFVGNEDLLFKMENGYHSYSNGNAHEKRDFEVLRGHMFAEDVWKNFHYNQVQPIE